MDLHSQSLDVVGACTQRAFSLEPLPGAACTTKCLQKLCQGIAWRGDIAQQAPAHSDMLGDNLHASQLHDLVLTSGAVTELWPGLVQAKLTCHAEASTPYARRVKSERLKWTWFQPSSSLKGIVQMKGFTLVPDCMRTQGVKIAVQHIWSASSLHELTGSHCRLALCAKQGMHTSWVR